MEELTAEQLLAKSNEAARGARVAELRSDHEESLRLTKECNNLFMQFQRMTSDQ